jgi:DNA-binding winged helix-turn-helix (wHTH) protein
MSSERSPSPSPERRLRFAGFELLTETGELFRDGERIPLQHQPAQLLALLAGRAGEAVSREEIRDAIWGRETFVDHDQSINYCVRQIRQALDDDPASPRFVETVPRHGYRFVARVEAPDGVVPPPEAAAPAVEAPARKRPGPRASASWAVWAAVGVVAVGLLVFLAFRSWSGATNAAGMGDDRGADGPAAEAAPPSQLVVPEEAHFRFLKARYLMERATPEEHVAAATEAIELLEAVIAEVPRHAEAHAALAATAEAAVAAAT